MARRPGSRVPAIALATLIVSALATTPARAADEAAPEPALELHDEAKRLYAQGDYEGAVDNLREAVRLDPDAKTLFYNLGLIEEKLGRIDDAIADYRRCLELEQDEDERAALERVIDRLQGARRKNAFASAAPAPAPAPAPPPPPTDDGVSPWVWVTAATAASAFAIGAVLASRAAATDPGDEATTSASVPIEQLEDDASAAHGLAVGADIAFVLGGAATVATVVIALTTAGPDEPTSPSVALVAGPTRLGLEGRF